MRNLKSVINLCISDATIICGVDEELNIIMIYVDNARFMALSRTMFFVNAKFLLKMNMY